MGHKIAWEAIRPYARSASVRISAPGDSVVRTKSVVQIAQQLAREDRVVFTTLSPQQARQLALDLIAKADDADRFNYDMGVRDDG